MKPLFLVLTSLAFVLAFSACSTCSKSQATSGCCAKMDCPPSMSCPAGSPQCKAKKAS